ncbi:hypothetical protein CEXT_671901 [Caerostris extrusa]|uniref:Uncharacterized protein n=1 Tax=Caerostris extrusa TaxID=172846 RepID=A0AAV4S150_CAEEX|nr:hypothetical protein CEXT_671901 [Caerostris extrusa]
MLCINCELNARQITRNRCDKLRKSIKLLFQKQKRNNGATIVKLKQSIIAVGILLTAAWNANKFTGTRNTSVPAEESDKCFSSMQPLFSSVSLSPCTFS